MAAKRFCYRFVFWVRRGAGHLSASCLCISLAEQMCTKGEMQELQELQELQQQHEPRVTVDEEPARKRRRAREKFNAGDEVVNLKCMLDKQPQSILQVERSLLAHWQPMLWRNARAGTNRTRMRTAWNSTL